MSLPRHANPAVDLLTRALIALPDLERLAETGQTPDDLTFLRELAAAARRFIDRMDAG